MLEEVKTEFGVSVVTDIHEAKQAQAVSGVVDIIQIPAFLCRQTDLLQAAVMTGKPLLIKKMQMMAPAEMANVVEKCAAFGGSRLIVCERGASFGYGNLVVDPTSFTELKALGTPVAFDVTHALQQPGALGSSTGGRGEHVESLAMAGLSQGLAALFFETHPEPAKALCDGPCALALDRVEGFCRRIKSMDTLVKSWG